jgi:hypothetical protein
LLSIVKVYGWDKEITISGTPCKVDVGGVYVVCHALSETLKHRAHPDCRIVWRGVLAHNTIKKGKTKHITPILYLLPISAITGPCLAVPNMEYKRAFENGSKKKPNEDGKSSHKKIAPIDDLNYLFIESRLNWSKLLQEEILDELQPKQWEIPSTPYPVGTKFNKVSPITYSYFWNAILL